MEKYLYLTRAQWVKTWVQGGKIPIELASKYLSAERAGTQTPDENLIHDSPVDLLNMGLISVTNPTKGSIHVSHAYNNVINGVMLPEVVNGRYFHEDGLILSYSNKKSKSIARRLGKRACVKILDINRLKNIIDEQLGVIGDIGNCTYTHDHQRSHFLKSIEDAWQHEYRMFWPITEPRSVILPAGLAETIKMKNISN